MTIPDVVLRALHIIVPTCAAGFLLYFFIVCPILEAIEYRQRIDPHKKGRTVDKIKQPDTSTRKVAVFISGNKVDEYSANLAFPREPTLLDLCKGRD